MEVAVKNNVFTRLKMLSNLNDRECIVRIGKNGRMLTSFKARTLDFVPVPILRKNRISYKKEAGRDKPKEKKAFNINTSTNLKEMMQKQSASRRRVNLENE